MKKEQKNKNLTTLEIIDIAYFTQDEEKYWDLLAELHRRGTIIEFQEAERICLSKDPVKREIGADVLGQLGWQKKAFQSESVSLLIQLLKDKNSDVIASAAFSLGHRNDPLAIPFLLKLINHNNTRVRNGVTFGLMAHDNIEAVNGLIFLSKDLDRDVKNWATFGIGSQTDLDNDEIRTTLLDRVDEEDAEIRGEALIGLAIRKDKRIKDAIIKELSGEFHGSWAVEAAALTKDCDYYPFLINLRDKLIGDIEPRFISDIEEAIKVCAKR
jgi:hypothetical protein